MDIFTMSGRYNRAKFFGISFAINIFFYAVSFTDNIVIMITAIIFGSVFGAFQIVKRLHDLNKPGTHYWLLYIPLYNVYFQFYLFFKKGIEGDNQYGSDPLSNNQY